MALDADPAMTGNLQAIGSLFTWVLGWGIGGSLIDAPLINAPLINAGVDSLEAGQLGTAATSSRLAVSITRSSAPKRIDSPLSGEPAKPPT